MPVNTDDGAHEARNETEIVGHEDDREMPVEFLQQLEEVLLHLLVEHSCGFVQEQEFGFGDESAGEQDPLSLSTREVRKWSCSEVLEVHLGKGAGRGFTV